jgi:hypothetical protein
MILGYSEVPVHKHVLDGKRHFFVSQDLWNRFALPGHVSVTSAHDLLNHTVINKVLFNISYLWQLCRNYLI